MFENSQIVGPEGAYKTLEEALAKCTEKTALLMTPGEHACTGPIAITPAVTALQAENPGEVTIKAPTISFDLMPSAFLVVTNINFDGNVVISGGSTVSFEHCSFTAHDGDAIVTVTDSSPNFRFCTFREFTGNGVSYNGSRGGIITDCTFENVKGESIVKTGQARPLTEHNTVK